MGPLTKKRKEEMAVRFFFSLLPFTPSSRPFLPPFVPSSPSPPRSYFSHCLLTLYSFLKTYRNSLLISLPPFQSFADPFLPLLPITLRENRRQECEKVLWALNERSEGAKSTFFFPSLLPSPFLSLPSPFFLSTSTVL